MRAALVLICSILLVSCDRENPVLDRPWPDLMEIPRGFDQVEFPEGNEFTLARWELGKKLFYDPIMASDMSISCGSCHNPELAFSDDQAFSPGVENRPGVRNSPSLANVAYHPYFTREGGVPTLEMQVLVPIQEHNEFDFNILEIVDRMNADEEYVQMSLAAYDQEPSSYVITRAIPVFERSLLSGDSPFDQWKTGAAVGSMSASQMRGMGLFFGERTQCTSCHGGFNFTDYAFENNGLYETYADSGRMRLTGEEIDRGRFKVPSLRNVELTAPYMHDGSMETLEDVVEHYNMGGHSHPNKSELISPLNLTPEEKSDLVNFLKALTDANFVSNPNFKN